MPLLNADELFQTLYVDGLTGFGVGGDLDTDSFDDTPFLTHQSVIAQIPNGRGAWQITHSVTLFLEPVDAPARTSQVYDLIHSWGETPSAGFVDDVGVVVTVEDLNAFSAQSGDVEMNNKIVRQYQGQFTIVARILPT